MSKTGMMGEELSNEVETFCEEIFLPLAECEKQFGKAGRSAIDRIAAVVVLLQENKLRKLPQPILVEREWVRLQKSRASGSIKELVGKGKEWLNSLLINARKGEKA